MAKMSRTWWGQRFLQALERTMDEGRLRRGRSYAGPSRLMEFTIDRQTVRATVRGNINPYFGVYKEPHYRLSIRLKAIPKTKWKAIVAELSTNAAWISRLLMNEMPDTIETAFERHGARLLPSTRSDLMSECSCPDYANPCKHIAGAYYKVASLLDRDPFLLFELRGMDKADLQQLLARSPLGQALQSQLNTPAQIPLEYREHRYTQPDRIAKQGIDLKTFWQGAEPVPRFDTGTSEGVRSNTVAAVLIKKQGDYPAFWERDNSFIEIMEEIYQRVATKNKESL